MHFLFRQFPFCFKYVSTISFTQRPIRKRNFCVTFDFPNSTKLGGSVILLGDVIERLKEIPSGVVQACITSPPYY